MLKFAIKKIFYIFRQLKLEFNLYKYSKRHKCNLGKNLNFIGSLENIHIGKNTTINNYANFRFTNARINIGENCLVARNVTILTKSYILDKQQIISTKNMKSKEVNIGNNVLLGNNVVIMPGVSIGDGSVVGAGSVVTKDIGNFEIWAGVPARFLRNRNTSDQ